MHNSTINQNYIRSCFDGEWYKICVGANHAYLFIFLVSAKKRNYRPHRDRSCGGGADQMGIEGAYFRAIYTGRGWRLGTHFWDPAGPCGGLKFEVTPLFRPRHAATAYTAPATILEAWIWDSENVSGHVTSQARQRCDAIRLFFVRAYRPCSGSPTSPAAILRVSKPYWKSSLNGVVDLNNNYCTGNRL